MNNRFSVFSVAGLALAATLVTVSCATPIPAPVPAPNEVASDEIPDPFWDFNPDSNFTINYADVDAILNAMVVNTGRSSREKLPSTSAMTGTRLATKVKRTTANEANRFYFEEFVENEEYKHMLRGLRQDLEAIPDQIPLENFNRDEQLAYWLNLYNIAILDKLVEIYPERSLKQELVGRNSILDDKFLNVSGVPLSLNDIQHRILRWNYDDNPLVIYGLYQGIIGGPNIRRWAYTGETVQKDLIDNAKEFVNSNRGTYSAGYGDFRVSSFYARNLGYFDNQASALRAHLLRYIDEPQKQQLEKAERIAANIDDWTITDVYGTARRVSGSLSHSAAAMQGAIVGSGAGDQAAEGAGTGSEGGVGPAVSVSSTTVSASATVSPYNTQLEDPRFARSKRADGLALPKIDPSERLGSGPREDKNADRSTDSTDPDASENMPDESADS